MSPLSLSAKLEIEQQSRRDFERALTRAFFRRVVSWLLRQDNDLLSFDDIRQCVQLGGRRELGIRTVPIVQIVGSVGRWKEFDRKFMPRFGRADTEHRWISIDKAHYQDVSLPPVNLYKVGEKYFVEDGNHRISVARLRGQDFVEAKVIEIDTVDRASTNPLLCGCPA